MKSISNALSPATLFLTLFLISFTSHGHGDGHHHPPVHSKPQLSQEKIKIIARNHLKRLAHADKDKKSKIDPSWITADFNKAEKKSFNGRIEWVVTFNNDKDKKGKTIYIFLNPNGSFVAANFTGK